MQFVKEVLVMAKWFSLVNVYIFIFSLFQGEVEIRDGDINADFIRIEIQKMGPDQETVNNIMTNQMMHESGRGLAYMMQVVSTPQHYTNLIRDLE